VKKNEFFLERGTEFAKKLRICLGQKSKKCANSTQKDSKKIVGRGTAPSPKPTHTREGQNCVRKCGYIYVKSAQNALIPHKKSSKKFLGRGKPPPQTSTAEENRISLGKGNRIG